MKNILEETLSEFIPKDGIYGYFVNGLWKKSSSKKTIKIFSPIDNSKVGQIQSITKEEQKDLIEIAAKAFSSWRDEPINKRAEILIKAAEIICQNSEILTHLITWEIGKPYEEAKDEVIRTAKLIEFYANEGLRIQNDSLYSDSFPGSDDRKIAITKKVPYGVVLAIAPFNYPINEGAPKIVGALITGNTVVYKPSTQGSISSLYMIECFRLAGLPAGVLNVVTGNTSELGEEMVSNKNISLINFTGSTQTAQKIKDHMGMVPFITGLSGKDAAIILNDADLSITVPEVAQGSFTYASQRCTSLKRILVQNEIAPKFKEELCEYVSKHFILGDPREKDTTLGPVINMNTVKLLDELLDDAIGKGARVLTGGNNDKYDNRLFYPPTILDNVKENMRIAWEEPFGPIVPIINIKTMDQAIEIANKSEYGLQSCVFTQDINKAFYIAEKLEVATAQINGRDARGPDHFPFIGSKASGLGQMQGAKYLIESMTWIKTIVINKNY